MENNQAQAQTQAVVARPQAASLVLSSTDPLFDILMDTAKFSHVQRVADLYSKSGLVPDTFKGNVAACFVGIQLAVQLGVNPFMLFQKVYFIGGKPAIEAQLAIAIANKNQVFEGPIEYTFTGENKNKTRSCTASAVLARNHKRVEMTIDWSIVDGEGWSKRGGSKWLTMPDQMFRYRSAMWLIRTFVPEVVMGMYSREELEDGIEAEYTRVESPAAAASSAAALGGGAVISFPAPDATVTPKPEEVKQPEPKVEKPKKETKPKVEKPAEPKAQEKPVEQAPKEPESKEESAETGEAQAPETEKELPPPPAESSAEWTKEAAEKTVDELIEKTGMNVPAKKAGLETLLKAAAQHKTRDKWTKVEYDQVIKVLNNLIARQAKK